MTDDDFLARAVALSCAGSAAAEGGPFGAVVVHDGEVVGEGCNRVVASEDPTAHAEVVAIRAAARRLARFDLAGTTIYSSCEPCPMCWAAIAWARCDRIVYANTAAEAAAIGFDDAHLWEQMAQPVDRRDLRAEHRPRPDALQVFTDWYDDPERTPY